MSTRTLFLNEKWDLALDGNGRLKIANGAYATAQDVANAVRLFTNDAYLAADRGIPHFSIDLGLMPSAAVVRSRMRKAALDVSNVASATVTLYDVEGDRKLKGVIEITTNDGQTAEIEL